MNYYEHHLGDWAAATGHLTWDEDMAYTRLLRAYYHHERAIPDGQQYRLAKAATPAQRRAVDQVLAEFFELRDEAFHQKRADAEIARYQDKQRKAKASANARWSQSERNANASPDAMRTHSEGNALQTPDTILVPKVQKESAKRPPPVEAPEGMDPGVWRDWLALRKAKKAPVTQTVLDGAVSEAAKAGVTLEEFLRVWCRRGSQGLEADWLKPNERPAGPGTPALTVPRDPAADAAAAARRAEEAAHAAHAASPEAVAARIEALRKVRPLLKAAAA